MTDEIRLLVLNCEYPPIGGGAARATKYILDELSGLPVRWTLVTASDGDAPRTEKHGDNGRIDYLAIGKKNRHYWSARELLAYALAATRHIGRLERAGESYDLCHAFFTVPAGAVAILRAKRRPYLVSLRGSDVPGETGRFVWFYRAFGFAIRKIWEHAAAVVANSDELRQLAVACGAEAGIEVIPNGIDTRKFRPAPDRGGGFTILTVGRLVPGKDLATVIRATAIVRERFPKARLIIVGEGPEKESLRRLAAETGIEGRVEFRGWVAWEAIDEVYREADVFVLTSLREGMSNTVLEALATGLPVVASEAALSGIDAEAAVAPPGDARAAAEAIARYLGDDAARREASKASLAAAGRYTWRETGRRYYELYRRIAGRSETGDRS